MSGNTLRIVLCNGVFDVFHYGHLKHLQAARKWGDKLVVGLTVDDTVGKGDGRPVFNWYQRKAILEALRCVDEVVGCVDAYQALKNVQPDIFVKGKEYDGKIEPHHLSYCYENNIEIRFTNEPVYSSTKLLRYELERR